MIIVSLGFLTHAGWQLLNPASDRTVHLSHLNALTTVQRDASGIPHIRAANALDAYRALGYVHAQDRMWQMEMNRRIANGRMAEILGSKGLEIDQFTRTLGVKRQAERIWPRLNSSTQAALNAYAEGVNAWLGAQTRWSLPVEFLLLNVQPEPWQVTDSIGWQTMMAWDLSANWPQEMLRMRLAQRLSLSEIQALLAPYPGDASLATRDYPALYRSLSQSTPSSQLAQLGAQTLQLAQVIPSAIEGMGSNNWVLAGSRTVSGKPLLANDPHLALSTPSLWYMAELSAPDLHVIGATLPGLPAVVLGHNDRIAWGFTNTASDVQDVYIERIRPNQPDFYQTPEGWARFYTRQEVIRVKGQGDVTLNVRETRHGPVISDVALAAKLALTGVAASEKTAQPYVLALQWAALQDVDLTVQAGLQLNQARDWGSFVRALQDFHAPQQNIVYADVDGNIGFIAPGRIPLRKAENDLHGLAPAPGWEARYDWAGWIPFAQLPQSYNPPSGQIVTANQKITPPNYPYFLTSEWALPYRADRIENLLNRQAKHSVASLTALQQDAQSGAAKELLPLLQAQLTGQRSPLQGLAQQLLKDWDGQMRQDSTAPLVFAAWSRSAAKRIFLDELGSDIYARSGDQRNLHQVLVNVLKDPQGQGAKWCDNRLTPAVESCQSQVQQALDDAMSDLLRRYGTDVSRWQWGKAHLARSEHRPLGKNPLLDGWFSVQVPSAGDTFSVNVGRYSSRDERSPFISTHAASLRVVYDLADWQNSQFIYPTGQSGVRSSPFYRDLAQDWANGLYRPLRTDASKIAQDGRSQTLYLQP